MSLLEVERLEASYGRSQILRGVSLSLREGELVSLIGRNGCGRSTTLKALMGIVASTSGTIRLAGQSLVGRRPFQIARAGLAYVPEERLVFGQLSVMDNFRLGMRMGPGAGPVWRVEQMFEWFPRLWERRNTKAGVLSGGEQQMLTLCRSLLGNPRLIMIDEPTEGLAPQIVEVVVQAIRAINARGVAVLLVEQKLSAASRLGERIMVMGHGHVVHDGTMEDLRSDPSISRRWLEVAG